jgi:hypothetical protein
MMPDMENVGTIIPGEQLPPGAQETVEHDQNTVDSGASDIETRARAMGWVAQDEFRGDPARWRPAEEFVQRGENEMPLLRENLRRTTDQLTQLQERLARQEREHKDSITRIERMSAAALTRQREQLEASYAAGMRNAAAAGDIDQYQRIESAKAAALSNFDQEAAEVRAQPKAEPPPQGQAPSPEYISKVDSWAQRNVWYKTDPELHHIANGYSAFLAQQNPGISLDENMRMTEAHIRKRYADRLGSAPGGPAPVEGGGGRMGTTMGRGKGWNDLPEDARRIASKQIKEGLFKDQNDFAAEYWRQ